MNQSRDLTQTNFAILLECNNFNIVVSRLHLILLYYTIYFQDQYYCNIQYIVPMSELASYSEYAC
jgi:hypothetical protein